MKTPNTPENCERFLHALQMPSKPLSTWELQFLESVQGKFDRRGFLTDGEFDKLEEIFAEKTD